VVEAFLLAFGVILVAELGDKSQLLTLAFATRYRAWEVLIGVAVATLLMQAGAVIAGAAFAMALPTELIQVAAGIAFLAFALWTLRSEDAEVERPPRSGGMAVVTVAAAIAIAEFGDKTMLVTLTIAATNDPLGTWLGASAGMLGANLVAVIAGTLLGSRLPRRPLRLVAAFLFVVFGAVLLAEGLGLV
jgi:Ca2+/H+ antiporter, TMEM165/GDT1 family